MIIFFDWIYDGLDGGGDHTSIVEKVEGCRVYTIEGNSGDVCEENSYPLAHYEILDYAHPLISTTKNIPSILAVYFLETG